MQESQLHNLAHTYEWWRGSSSMENLERLRKGVRERGRSGEAACTAFLRGVEALICLSGIDNNIG